MITQYILTQNELDVIYSQLFAQEIPLAVFPFHDEKYPELHYYIESGLLNGMITVVKSITKSRNKKLKLNINPKHRYPKIILELIHGKAGSILESNSGQQGTESRTSYIG